MDRDNRDNIRTINSAATGQPNDYRTNSSGKASQASRLDPHSCLARARRIFSCYRRDEAQDPEGFVANLSLVLADYPADIVEIAADPRTGIITAHPMGLPNVGQIREFLEAKLVRREHMERLAALPKVEKQTYFPRPAPMAGDLANVFVPSTVPIYALMVKKAEAKDANPREYRYSADANKPGIFVALNWLDDPQGIASKKLKQISLSEDELRRLYPKKGEDAA